MRDPYSLEAEQGFLGSLLIRPELVDSLSDEVMVTDFYWPENGQVYKAILALAQSKERIDHISVADSIGTLDNGDMAMPYVIEIAQNTPSAANAQTYARIIRERALDRALLAVAQTIHETAYGTQPTADKIAQAQAEVLSLDSETATAEIVSATDVMRDHVEELQRRADLGGKLDGLETGIPDLDKAIQGMKPGQLIVIAGRAKMGKTTFAMGIARHNAIRCKKHVLLISLEMSNGQIMDRMLAAEGSIPLSLIKNGQACGSHASELTAAAGLVMHSNLKMTERPGLTISRIRSMARRHKHIHGLDLLLIDHLGLLDGEDPRMNQLQKVSEITRQSKIMANELGVPVILLSQLNRALEQRADKRPIPSDLRDSGTIEQDADMVLFVYRDEVYNSSSQHKGFAEIIIGLGRDIEAQTIFTKYEGQYNRFVGLGGERVPEIVHEQKTQQSKSRGMQI